MRENSRKPSPLPTIATHLLEKFKSVRRLKITFSISPLIGVLIAPASSASFAEDIFALVTSIVAWAVVLLFSKVIINRTIIPGRTIMKEIKEDANWGFGLMDASTSIVITAIIILLHVN